MSPSGWKLSGTWYVQGDQGHKTGTKPGSGSSQRVNAKMACINFDSHKWRTQISAGIVGHADTAPLATTDAMKLACY